MLAGFPACFDDDGNYNDKCETVYFLHTMTTYEDMVPKADSVMFGDANDDLLIYFLLVKNGFMNQTQAAYAACAIAYRTEVIGQKTKMGSDVASVISALSKAFKRRMVAIAEDEPEVQSVEPLANFVKRVVRTFCSVLLTEWQLEQDDIMP